MSLNIVYHNFYTVVKNLEIFKKKYSIIKTIKQNQKRGVYIVNDNIEKKQIVLKFIINSNIMKENEEIFNFFINNKHPNFCKINKTFVSGIFFIIEMDYIEGDTLCEYFNKKHTKKTNYKILFDLLLSLEYLHNNDIVHGDIKPNNIIITPNNIPIIIDYDLSHFVKGTSTRYTKHIFGTKFFMSPEMIEHNKYSIKSDVWSLGMTLYLSIIKYYDNSLLTPDEIRSSLYILSLFSTKIKIDYGILFYNIIKIMLIDNDKYRPSTIQICNIIKKSRYFFIFYQPQKDIKILNVLT